jgi:hypothetical protein
MTKQNLINYWITCALEEHETSCSKISTVEYVCAYIKNVEKELERWKVNQALRGIRNAGRGLQDMSFDDLPFRRKR